MVSKNRLFVLPANETEKAKLQRAKDQTRENRSKGQKKPKS